MNEGWYKHHRNLFERPWAKDAKMIAVYEYLHCVAYVNDGLLHGQLIRRGSCLTSRTAIMDATGLSAQEVRSRLAKLLEYKEIIIKTTNIGTIVTICDYDTYGVQNDLFDVTPTNEQPTNNQPTTNEQPALYIKEGRIYNNILRSHYIPSKQRENKAVALEIKALYNKMFDGILRKWERLSADMIIKIDNCVARYGRQSVDMVFDQVKHEKFSLGDNNTGFIADFAFIFKLNNYEAYLGRYELRIKQAQQPKKQQSQSQKMVGVINDQPQQIQKQDRRAFLLGWVVAESANPSKRGQELLQACYDSGELAKLGIDWEPNKSLAI